MRTVVLLYTIWFSYSVNAFLVSTSKQLPQISTELYGGGAGRSTSLTGKKETVEKVKGLLEKSDLVFSVPASAITVAQAQSLRRALPEGTTCRVIKNKLMARAIEGTEYNPIAEKLLVGANMWFFVEDDVSGSIKAYNEFLKETNKRETHEIIGGCMEGLVYQSEGIQAIGKLPSKLELYTMIARSINAVPTKLARVVKEPGNKLARAIKLATDPDKDSKKDE
jgi:large subunit ribosomal protein L10